MTKKKIQTEPLTTAAEPPAVIETASPEEAQTNSPIEEEAVEESSPTKTKKKTVTCPHCKKSMLEKTFKYYHSLKCYPAAQTKYQQEATNIIEFAIGRREAKQNKYSNLFSRAV